MSFTLEEATRFYKVEALDYGSDRPGNWLLLGAGTGLMLSMMDMEPRHRYCVDTDTLRPELWPLLSSWLVLMEGAVDRVNACGWFSRYENGLRLIEALKVLKHRPLVYFGSYERPELLYHCDAAADVGDFIRRLNLLPMRRGELSRGTSRKMNRPGLRSPADRTTPRRDGV